jgi:hypothetical protein
VADIILLETGDELLLETGVDNLLLELLSGSAAWGHVTGVIEDNIRAFSDGWTGTGDVSSTGDAETIELNAGEYMFSETVYTDTRTVELLQNFYDNTGDDVTLEYRHGATQGDCETAGWNSYSVPFVSLGYVQARLESTL